MFTSMMNSIAPILKQYFGNRDLHQASQAPGDNSSYILTPAFGGFLDHLEIKPLSNGEFSLLFSSQSLPDRPVIDQLLQMLFETYGPDANEYTFSEIPNIGPFGGELYSWIVDENGKIVFENDDFHHSVEVYLPGGSCEFTIEKADVLIALSQVIARN